MTCVHHIPLDNYNMHVQKFLMTSNAFCNKNIVFVMKAWFNLLHVMDSELLVAQRQGTDTVNCAELCSQRMDYIVHSLWTTVE